MLRKWSAIAVGLVLCIGTTAAGQQRRHTRRKPMCKVVATLGNEDNGKSLTLKQGEGFAVQLDELAGAGYVWQPHMEPQNVVKLEHSSRELSSNAAMGAAAIRKFTFCAVSPGSTAILLEMRRPWEKSGSAAKSIQIQVNVSE